LRRRKADISLTEGGNGWSLDRRGAKEGGKKTKEERSSENVRGGARLKKGGKEK